jgi:hypothetical protein
MNAPVHSRPLRRSYLAVILAALAVIVSLDVWQQHGGSLAQRPAAGDDSGRSGAAEILPPVERPLRHQMASGSALVLRASEFTPVEMDAPATSLPSTTALEGDRPEAIEREPEYGGVRRWYGHLDLGNRPQRRYYLALDEQADGSFLLYFDRNQNGDLSDDGGPLRNMGTGPYAATVVLPWDRLIANSPFAGDFKIWFFVHEAGWRKGYFANHYSRTQLRSEIVIDGTAYMALLVDRGVNDADLTNDGVMVDTNRNGKIDDGDARGYTVVIGGKSWPVEVLW